MISRATPPHEKDGARRYEPHDSPDRKTEVHDESMTALNESRNGAVSAIDEIARRLRPSDVPRQAVRSGGDAGPRHGHQEAESRLAVR